MAETLPFIFGGTADAPTLEELKRRRAIAAAIAAQKKGFPKTLGEGLTYLGEAIGEAGLDWRTQRAEEALRNKQVAITSAGPAESGVPLTRTAPEASPVRPGTNTSVPPPRPVPALPGSDPVLPPTLSAAPPTEVVASAQAAPPEAAQAEVASAPDLPAPGVTSSEAPARSALTADGPPPEAIAALRSALAAQQPPPVTNVRNNITTALMNQPAEKEIFAQPERTAPQTAADIPFEGPMDDPRWIAREKAIAGIESAGSRDPYNLQGVATKGGRAQGKFQVMSDEVPDRTQASLGYRMTPEEFRANPNAQHIQFRQQFGDAINKYGEEGAARNWYGGDRGMYNLGATDAHGRLTVRSYGEDYMRKLNAALGEGAQVAGGAPATPPGKSYQTVAVRPAANMQEQPEVAAAAEIAAATPQQQVAQAPPPDEQDARLLQMLGAQARPGLRGATASLGRAGVANDAGPLGSIGSIGANDQGLSADVNARRNAIAGAIAEQPQPAPAVPAPDPTLTAGQPPSSTQTSTSSEPPIQVAQAPGGSVSDATIFSPRSVKTVPVQAQPETGIQKAPEGQLPTQEPIVGRQDKQFPDIKPLAPPPKPEDASPREVWLRQIQSSPYLTEQQQAAAGRDAAELEQKRLKRDELRNADWQFERNQHFELQKAKREWELGEGERLRKEQKERQDIQTGRYPKPEEIDGKLIFDPNTNTYTKPKIAGYDPNVAPNPKLNEDQRKTLIFYNWAAPAHELLKGKDKLFAEGAQQEVLGKVPFAGNKLLSDEYRLAKTAANNFVLAFMRSTSGAAYGAKEAEDHARGMLPKWGDDPKTAAFKAEERQRFVDSLHGSLGPAREVVDWHAQRKLTIGADKQQSINDEMREVQPRGFGDVRVNKKTGAKRVWNGSIWMEE
jgi:hypothetical protein